MRYDADADEYIDTLESLREVKQSKRQLGHTEHHYRNCVADVGDAHEARILALIKHYEEDEPKHLAVEVQDCRNAVTEDAINAATEQFRGVIEMADDEMQIPARAQAAKAGEVGGFNALPKGEYPCLITKGEKGDSAKIGGTYYRFEMQVLSGPHQNRTFSLFLSFNHPNSDSAAESDKHYANLCAATGVRSTKQSDYVNKTVLVSLDAYKVKKGEKAGEMANKITNIKPRHAGPAPTPAPVNTPTGDPTAAPAAAPWGSNA